MKGTHAVSIQRSKRGDGRSSVGTQRGNRFEVGLDARATSAIGSGNGKYGWVTVHRNVVGGVGRVWSGVNRYCQR